MAQNVVAEGAVRRRWNNSKGRRRCASSRSSTSMVCSSGVTAEHVRRAVWVGEHRVEHGRREELGLGEGEGSASFFIGEKGESKRARRGRNDHGFKALSMVFMEERE
jgi:hypothetical protein